MCQLIPRGSHSSPLLTMVAAPLNGKTFPDTVSYEHNLVTICEGNRADNIGKSLVFEVSWSPGKRVERTLSRLWEPLFS